MTNTGKSSEERIRQARSRLAADHETQVEPDLAESDPDSAEGPSYRSPETPGWQTPPDIPEVLGGSQSSPPQQEPPPLGYSDPSPRTAPRLIASRWFRLAVIVAVGLGYGLFTSLDDADRSDTGEIVAAGDLDVMAVQPGDCFDDPPTDEETVFQLEAVPCSEPHDNEVFAVESMAASFGSEYPGRQALEETGYQVCSGSVFDAYVGNQYLDSSLDVFTLTPTTDSWSEGDRDVVCVLYKLDLSKLTQSARNSGL